VGGGLLSAMGCPGELPQIPELPAAFHTWGIMAMVGPCMER